MVTRDAAAPMDNSEDDSVFEEKPSKKLSRKLVEKLRRDRLNSLITQLAEEIPLVKYAHRRLDKLAILRLTVSYLKLNQGLKRRNLGSRAGVHEAKLFRFFNKVTDEALMILTQSGTVLYVSPKVTQISGFYQTDMVGHNVKHFVHPDDLDLLMSQFYRSSTVVNSSYATFPETSEDFKPTKLQILQAENSLFYIRLLKAVKGKSSDEVEKEYEPMLVHTHCERDLEEPSTDDEVWMVATLKPETKQPIIELELKASEFLKNNEWATMHDLDSKIIAVDQRASLFNGFLASEVKGKTPYLFINEADLESVALSHQIILQTQDIPSTVYRMNNKMDAVVYVQSRSVIINDQWTKKPKCIVSVNTVLRNTEGKYLLSVQKKKVEEWKKISGNMEEVVKSESLCWEDCRCADKRCSLTETSAKGRSNEKQVDREGCLSLQEVYDKKAQRFPELFMKVENFVDLKQPVTKRSFGSMDSESSGWESLSSGSVVNSSAEAVSDTSSTSISDVEDASPKQRSPSIKDLLSSDQIFKKASSVKSDIHDSKSLPLLRGALEGHMTVTDSAYSPSENYMSRDMVFKHGPHVGPKASDVSMNAEHDSFFEVPTANEKSGSRRGSDIDLDQSHSSAHGVQSPTIGSSEGLQCSGTGDMDMNGIVSSVQNRFTAQLESKHAMLQQAITSQRSTLEILREQIQCSHNNIILDSSQKHIHDKLLAKLLDAESQLEIQTKLLGELQEEIKAQKEFVAQR